MKNIYLSYLLFAVVLNCSLLAMGNKYVLSNDGEVEFFGIVLDQYEKPVDGATITYSTITYDRAYDNFRRYKTTTDKNGGFRIEGIRTGMLGIDFIECPGYESRKFNDTFEYSRYSEDKFTPDPENPVVFKIRKYECKPEFVINGELNFYRNIINLDKTYQADIIRERIWEVGKKDDFVKTKVDFEMIMHEEDNKGGYTVKITVPDKDSGILKKSELLYVAPEDGYKNELTLSFPVSVKNSKTYLYFKGRGGKFYSRLEMNTNIGDKIDISFKTRTNPFASRCLEEDDSIIPKKGLELLEKAMEELGY